MDLDYADYITLFNTGDDQALVDRFFDDDIVFTGGSGVRRGKAELMGFLNWAHDGVREVMRPQNVLRDGDFMFVEVDMDFHASKPRPDFPFAKLRPGDSITVKFFVTYRLRNGKVVELRSMTWPAEKGVTKVPRLGSHPTQQAAFRAYAAAFSAAEFETFPLFYTEDVLLELGSVPPIHGRQGIVDFYRPMFARVRETVTPHELQIHDDQIFLDATSRFTAVEDAPDFVVGALKQGEAIEVRVHVRYRLENGLIKHISVSRAGAPVKQDAP